MNILLHLLLGMVLSLIASIPVGPVNLAVVEVSLRAGKMAGYRIALGSAIIEFGYCMLAIWGINQLFDNQSFIFTLKIVSIPVLSLLGIWNLIKKIKVEEPSLDKSTVKTKGTFLLGASLTLLNPMLLPFWLAVSIYLKNLEFFGYDLGLLTTSLEGTIFSLGVGLGSFLLLFIITNFSANKELSHENKVKVNRFLGVLFLVIASYQIYSVYSLMQ